MLIIKELSKSIYLVISVLIFLFLLDNTRLACQTNKNGIPLLRNYTSEEYNAHEQNWAIIRDKIGVMYFGNNFGLLEYNGVRWTLHENNQSSAILALGIDDSRTIYYGSAGDFGMMVPNPKGGLSFFSIYRKYTNVDADFNAIRGIHVINDKVIFRSSEKIFIYTILKDSFDYNNIKQNIKEISTETSFHKSFQIGEELFVKQTEVGLMKLKGEKLVLIEGSQVFAEERIYFMAPYKNNRIIIGSRESGLYIYDPGIAENSIIPFECSANDLIKSSAIYDGVALPNYRFALATLTKGVIIINENGEVEEQLSNELGILDQTILSIYYDGLSANLWFSTNESGIYKAFVGSPFREWNRINGIEGVVSDIIRFNNILYVSTSIGVFYLEQDDNRISNFVKISGISSEAWDFELFKAEKGDDRLLVGTASGIYEISDKKAKLVINNGVVYKLYQSRHNPKQLFIGYIDGIGFLEFNKGDDRWTFRGRNKVINSSIKSILESEKHKLYLSTEIQGIILLDNIMDDEPMVIDTAQGLPIAGADFRVYEIDNQIVIASMKGLFKYDEDSNKVTPYLKFGKELSGGDYGVYRILQTESDDYWMSLFSNNLKKSNWQGIARMKLNNDDSLIMDRAFSKIIPQKVAHALYEDGDFFWIANDKGLYNYNKKVKEDFTQPFDVKILNVTSSEDTLFAGTFYELKDSIVYFSIVQAEKLKPELLYKDNQVTFEYAALFYDQEENTEYSYRLLGSSEKWSKWTKETKFTYTNLSPNFFRFEIRARNIYGTISNTTSYEFTVLPPWYMTYWAYALFIIAFIGFVWAVVRLNTRRLKKDKEKLEKIVKERTQEIRLKNAELEQQKEEISAQRDEIEAQRDYVILQKEQIEEQHDKIVEQKKSITDSIHYASRIQKALLPPKEMLTEVMPEHFILYKPRDIVSGDFYWASKKDNKTIIVAGDCTGHGVPGAFMSMLGISYLNELVNKANDLHANQILNELKENIKRSLRQTGKENEAKDGMDMALCILDTEKMQMEFSGAFNSLLLIRDNQMIKYDADRMPVGIYVKERGSFTNHLIDMKEGDNYYIYSDGYIDQFGGEKGTKLMSKRFKDLLLQNHQKSADEQRKALDDFLNYWQSFKNEDGETYRQLDDILVIGIRI